MVYIKQPFPLELHQYRSGVSPDPSDWNYHTYSSSFHKDGNLQKMRECFEFSIREGFQKAKSQPIEQSVYLHSF